MCEYVIYKIVCDEVPDFVYVGSTKSFRSRKCQHKMVCNSEKSKNHNLKLYQTIREHGGWDAWRVVIIEQLGNVTKLQANIREEELRLELNANMNMYRAYRTGEQKKEQLKELQKEYHKKNKEEIIQKRKENSEKFKQKNKEYRKQNREKIKQQKKEYTKKHYKENREKYKQKNKEDYAKRKLLNQPNLI